MAALTSVTRPDVETRTRPRGPLTDWHPQARTVTLIAAVSQVLDQLQDYLPVTLRQVFYRLVATADYPKTETAYARLCETAGKARRAGMVPMASIRDDGMHAEIPTSFGSPEDFRAVVHDSAARFRLDRQDGQAQRLEVWCEAAGMVPQLVRVADPYGIPVRSCSGFDSLTAKHQTAIRAARSGLPLLVLHVGDLDPSGVHLYNSAAEDVTAWADHYGAQVSFQRVAVTPEQVATYQLATDTPKKTDRRSFTGLTTQAEALDPPVLASIVTDAIDNLIDPMVLTGVLDREQDHRNQLLTDLEGWT